jgi:hypothetical protein
MRDIIRQKIVDSLGSVPPALPKRQELIQVCSSLEDPETREREIRALVEAAQEHPRARKCIITLPASRTPGVPEDVVVHDAAAWLLGDHASE